MSTYTYNTFLLTVLAFSLAIFFASPLQADSGEPRVLSEIEAERNKLPTIYEGVGSEPKLTTFVSLMLQAFPKESLLKFFNENEGTHTTIFAPSNEAFEALLESLNESDKELFLDPNNGLLANILRYHFTRGDWVMSGANLNQRGLPTSLQLETASDPAGGLKMVNDEIANIYREGDDLRIEGATITDQRVFRNGIITIIDQVLRPLDTPESFGCSPFTSEHNNSVDLALLNALSASYNWVNVTNCQPHASHPVTNSGGFTFEAGRHDSSGPANAFKNGLNNKMIATFTEIDSQPSELNFSWSANISVTLEAGLNDIESFNCSDVRFGQGSTTGINNWWVGQPNAIVCPFVGDNIGITLQCTNTLGHDSTIALVTISPSLPNASYIFNVSVVPTGVCPSV